MKKIFFGALALVSIGLSGCEKECSSTCGTIANDGIDLSTNCYWLEIRNECSGNKRNSVLTKTSGWKAMLGSTSA